MNAKDDKKKNRETFLLEQFFKQQGIAPTNLVPSEGPDFLMELDGRAIGVEITEVHVQGSDWKPNPHFTGELRLRAIENYTADIVSKAREIYFKAEAPLISAQIVLSNSITDATNRDRVAELLAYQIIDMTLQNPYCAEWRPGTFAVEDNLLCESVDFIHVSQVLDEQFARWTTPNVGLVATLTPEHLLRAVNKKKGKINNYKLRVSEIWLVMVADRELPSQKFQCPPNFSVVSLSSPFDRTFYYGHMANEPVIEF